MTGWPNASRVLVVFAVLLLGGARLAAQDVIAGDPPPAEPLRVGEEVPLTLQSLHPYAAGTGAEGEPVLLNRFTVHDEGTTYVSVHFAALELAPGDTVVVRSPDHLRSWTYTDADNGRGRSGFWSVPIPGEQALVELWSRTGGAYGFFVDRYARSLQEAEPSPIRAVCGADDSLWAACYADSHPLAHEGARSVARLFINGTLACTGFLVGSEGHLLTNHHCVSDPGDAASTTVEMMAEGAGCDTDCAGWFACPGKVVAAETQLTATNAAHDYSLLALPTNPSLEYGYLQLRKEGGLSEEAVHLPQHPLAWGKRIALASTDPHDESGLAELWLQLVSSDTTAWLYFADTQGGSSGAPVVAASDHRVVAVHRGVYDCDGYGNAGTAVQLIVADLGPALPADAISWRLDVELEGEGTGVVSSSPAGIVCGTDCSEEWGNGHDTIVNLTPVPATGSVFAGFGGDPDCADGAVIMAADIRCTARFDVARWRLTFSRTGAGAGTVTSSPAGIDCGLECEAIFDHGTVIRLTAEPAQGSTFVGFAGDAGCAPGVFSMRSDLACSAEFSLDDVFSDGFESGGTSLWSSATL